MGCGIRVVCHDARLLMSMTLTLKLSFSYSMAMKSNTNLKENPVSKVKGVCAHFKNLTSMPATHGQVEKKISFSALECLTYPMHSGRESWFSLKIGHQLSKNCLQFLEQSIK